ncbi:MAG: hypothetical protein AABX11_03850 [Nanoarchaeota archaeon]
MNKNKISCCNERMGFRYLGIFVFVLIFFTGIAWAIDWIGTPWTTTTQGTEDGSPSVSFNLSQYISYTAGELPLSFMFGADQNISSSLYGSKVTSFYSWITLNSSSGILTINSTNDNQTGEFNISLVTYEIGGTSVAAKVFPFLINATNDVPNFTLVSNYTMSVMSTNNTNSFNLTGSDEEQHYPLSYNISFNSCSLAAWSSRIGTSNNCNLSYLITGSSNITSVLNITDYGGNDIGTYNVTICAKENVNSVALPTYRDSSYNTNRSVCKNTTLIVERALSINVSNCSNSILNESVAFSCYVNVTTKGEIDSLLAWSNSTLRNTGAGLSNSSWFFLSNSSSSSNYSQSYYIAVTPQKTEIGNLTVNFTVRDITTGENSSSLIYIYVNRTTNSVPVITSISNVVTSVDLPTNISFNVSDNDLLIPDKALYNESANITWSILNVSDNSQVLSLSDFDILSSGTGLGVISNLTRARIEFTASSIESGNYTINLSVRDEDDALAYTLFNISILNNHPPLWINPIQTTFMVNETQNVYLNLSLNVSDEDEDILTFSYVLNNSFPSFNLNSSTGIINFTGNDSDVGQHLVNITVNDGYLSNVTEFNFTILNLNDNLTIESFSDYGFLNSTTNSNTTEDTLTNITLWIYDNDILIPSGQKAFYNESFMINVTIEGANTSLFSSFSKTSAFPDSSYPNKTEYIANFTPGKADVGNYNITINVTDASNYSSVLRFNMTVLELSHNPTLTAVSNQTASILQTFNYNFSASDVEDGNSSISGNTNFIFYINDSLSLINFNSSYFNNNTGVLSVLFNQTQAGNHLISLTVSDSDGMNASTTFGLKVYDYPNVTYPSNLTSYNATENSSTNFIFAINHTVADSLNYSFYLNSVLINASYSIANGSNITFIFTPNFTQESYGTNSNLSLFVYNSVYSELNSTGLFYFNISHANYPVVLYANISNQSSSSNLTLSLKDYFRDFDADDVNINQSIRFNYTLVNLSSGAISITQNNWVNGSSPNITFSASASSSAIYSISAYEYNESNDSQIIRNLSSNNFSVDLNVEVVSTPSPSTGGGGGGSSDTVNTIKIIVSPLEVIEQDGYFSIPFQIKNTGQGTLSGINLDSLLALSIQGEVNISLSKLYIDSLSSGESEEVILYIFADTNKSGKYLVTLFANVTSPKISDWADFYLEIIEPKRKVKEIIIFTEQLMVDNPECRELNELLNEAKSLMANNDFDAAFNKAQEAIDGCRKIMALDSKRSLTQNLYGDYTYYFLLTFLVMAMFLIYILYKRARFKSKFPHNI